MSTHLFLCLPIFWHVLMPTFMSTHQDADRYANTLRCWHILLVVRNIPTYMSAHLFLCWQICWHVQKPTYMSTHEDVNICRHILLVLKNMPTYMSPHFFECWQICRYIQMLTYMSTYWYAEIGAGTLSCRHMSAFYVDMQTVALDHILSLLIVKQRWAQIHITYITWFIINLSNIKAKKFYRKRVVNSLVCEQ